MGKKKIKKTFAVALAICTAVTFAPAFSDPAQAASVKNPSLVTMDSGKTYKTYDVTGDGVPDRVSVKTGKEIANEEDDGIYDGFTVYVNGKSAYRNSKACFGADMVLCTLNNGSVYLYVRNATMNDNHSFEAFLKYDRTSSKFKNAAVAEQMGKLGYIHTDAYPYKISGNSILLNCQLNYNGPNISYKEKFTEKSGKLVLQKMYSPSFLKSSGRYSNSVTLGKSLKAYKKSTCKGALKTISRGSKIKVTKMKLTGKTLALGFSKNGSTWWFNIKKAGNYGQFRNLLYST